MSKKEKSAERPLSGDTKLESLEIGSAVYRTRLTNKFKNRPLWEKPDEKRVEAVIPGTIQKIMVKEGDTVTAGTPLLILEAMKMRNEVLAPLSGTITRVHVTVGEMVPKSHLLVEMD
ncbi:MAG: acetyl-CoA carboxylase biotin carboxyl carrier protein subunit [Bacteroidales bacterium]|nr:acetyl-CoA carboxylase biotin carboxyl carrier protein subunit [Bacteroidales bacterium]